MICEEIKPMDGYCYCSYTGMQACYDMAAGVLKRRVPGAFVECGVAAGGMAGCFAKAMVTAGEVRPFHLYDSFRGIPIAGPQDDCQPGQAFKSHPDADPLRDRLKPSGIGPAVPLENVRRNLTEAYGLASIPWVFHEGWFQDTLPQSVATIGPIALLHLDGDLYESTIVCLEWLYPLVSRGGVVIVDDYALKGCERAVKGYFREKLPDLQPFADYGAVMWLK